MLQWGRAFSSAEIGLVDGCEFPEGRKLQWGRAFSSAEIFSPIDEIKSKSKSFNGAALFQARKL